jgi:hypothetical protein
MRSSEPVRGKLVSENFTGADPELELKKLANWFPKWEEYANLKP